MGLFSKKIDDGILSTNLIFMDGIDKFAKNEVVTMSFNKEKREVTISSTDKKRLANLSVDKINIAKFMSETEIKEKSKSVGGRAVVGGILLGPLGALVGGASGVGDKKKKTIRNYIIINYSEDKALSFEIPPMNLNFRKVLAGINENIVQQDIEL